MLTENHILFYSILYDNVFSSNIYQYEIPSGSHILYFIAQLTKQFVWLKSYVLHNLFLILQCELNITNFGHLNKIQLIKLLHKL